MRRRFACAVLLLGRIAPARDALQEEAPTSQGETPSAPIVEERAGSRSERARPPVVLLLQGVDSRWTQRAQGQLSDLQAVVTEEPAQGEGNSEAQRLLARRLARARGADVVAWLSSASPASAGASVTRTSEVRIWLASSERLYTRQLGTAWGELTAADQSAALEIAALTLRSALRAFADDAIVQTTADEPRRELEPAPSGPGPFRVGLAASWQLDGQTSRGAGAAGAEVGVAWRRWSWSAGGFLGLEAQVGARDADLLLTRHSAFLQTSYALLEQPAFSCGALLRTGLALSRRETRPSVANALPTPPQTQRSALLGGGLRGSWHFAAAHALTLTAAATWQPAAPRYSIQVLESEQVFEYPLWQIQPSVELGWSMIL